MSRVTLLLVFLAGMAIPAGASAAQPVELPDCRLKEKAESLVAGAIPDFAGCVAEQVQSLVARVRPDIDLKLPSDATVPGAQPRLVTGQVVRGNTLTLVVPSRAGLQPPVGQDPAVVVPTPPPGGLGPGPSPPPPPPPPPRVEMPRFSISGSPRVTEGEPLIFQINRDGDHSKPQQVIISYDGESFLVGPPKSIEFPAGQSSMSLQLATAEDPAQNGERRVDVQLEEIQGGRVAEGRTASGFIDDAAATPPRTTSYSISLEGVATRGQPIRFVVSRTGPLAAAEIVYDVMPVGPDSPVSGGARRILFGQDLPSLPINVPPEDYNPCGDPVTITVQRGSTEETARNVEFTEFTPAECAVIPQIPLWKQVLNWLDTNVPWWLLIAAIVAMPLGWAIWKLFDPGGPKPLPPVTAKCSIERGTVLLGLDSGSVGRWPPLKALVTMERGIGRAPNPLPIAEPSDG